MARFGHNETGGSHCCILEVPDGTGSQKNRTADAISMSLWPSRGLTISGYEIKISRTDWLKELKNPAKAEWFWSHCDHWSLVVGDKSIVRDGELPDSWGLMVPHGSGLKFAKQPPLLEENPIDRAFLAGLLRAACKHEPACEREIRKRERDKYNEGVDFGRVNEKAQNKYMLDKFDELKTRVAEFEKHTGLNIKSRWNNRPEQLGQMIEAIKEANRQHTHLARLIEAIKTIEEMLPGVQAMFAPLEQTR